MLFSYGQFFIHTRVEEKYRDNILGVSLTQLKQLFCFCHIMLSLIMSKTKASNQRLEVYVNLLLSCCHRFCEEYYDKLVTEFWFSKVNFILLLNLPEQMNKFGYPSL